MNLDRAERPRAYTLLMAFALLDVLPQFVTELEQLLKHNEPVLAAQVRGLSIIDRCRCGDDFCATFYTEPPPKGRYGPNHRTLPLEPNCRNDHS